MRIIYTLQYSSFSREMGVVHSKIFSKYLKLYQPFSQSFAVAIYHYSNKFIYFKFNWKKNNFFRPKFMMDYKMIRVFRWNGW